MMPSRAHKMTHEDHAQHRIKQLESALELQEARLRKAVEYNRARDMAVARKVLDLCIYLTHSNINPLNIRRAVSEVDLAAIIREVK